MEIVGQRCSKCGISGIHACPGKPLPTPTHDDKVRMRQALQFTSTPVKLSVANPHHRVIVECAGFRIKATLAGIDQIALTDEQVRHALQTALEEQKIEDEHGMDVAVTLDHSKGRPVYSINLGGVEVYTLG